MQPLSKPEAGAVFTAARKGYSAVKRTMADTEGRALDRGLKKLAAAVGLKDFEPGQFGTPLRGKKATEAARTAHKQTTRDFRASILPIIEDIRTGGITSYNGIAIELNRRGTRSSRGGAWSAKTVRDIMGGE